MKTSTASKTRDLRVEALTRVEGEGGLSVRLDGKTVTELKLNIFEPPRFFEAFLRGRQYHEVPDITARICGICPVAYQMSAVQALEAALEVTPSEETRLLRRLMYCAEWIESHALHIYMLQAPDFFGKSNAIELAREHPNEVNRGLRLHKVGNELLRIIGGRAIHPVTVCVGGFYKFPKRSELLALKDELAWALGASLETVKFVRGFRFPELTPDYEFVSLSGREYPMNSGRIVTSKSVILEVSEFEQMFLEEHVERSNALHSVRADRGTSYLVGPLARLNLNQDALGAQAKEAAISCGMSWPMRNPFTGIIARAIELVEACSEALRLIDAYREPQSARVDVKVHAGEGSGATEAPRGLLYHHYRINDRGLVEFAKIVPPTSQNLRRMEDDLRLFLPSIADRPDQEVADACEGLIRSYDPCISCSVHAVNIRRE